MVTAYIALLLLLAAERLIELVVSRRNVAWALAQGGIEVGHDHFPWMVVLHGSFFFACAGEVLLLERPFHIWLGVPMMVVLLAAQTLRYWAIASLGRRWNVRVVVIPGAPLVESGPYRYIRHPNYLAIVLELASVPLIHSAWLTAAVYSFLNALVLRARIRSEEEALARYSRCPERLAKRPRFIPSLQREVLKGHEPAVDTQESAGSR